MKLSCSKCGKLWDDIEAQNQVCNECGTSGCYNDYDEQGEEILIRMAEDPEFAEEVIAEDKKERKRHRILYLVYASIGIASSIIGYEYFDNQSRLWFWGGIALAMISHSYYNKFKNKKK